MKDKLEKRLQELESVVADNPAKMQGLVLKAVEEKRAKSDTENAEFTRLKKEMEESASEIRDIKATLTQLGAAARPVDFATGNKDFGKDEMRNIQKISLAKIVRASNPKNRASLDGLELELQSVAEQELRDQNTPRVDGAMLVPQSVMRNIAWTKEQAREQRDITSAATLGAELVNTFTDRNNYIEALRPYNGLMGAGVEMIENTSGDNVNYPRENSLYNAAMATTENATAVESLTATIFQTVAFTPKRATGFVQVSQQMGGIGVNFGGGHGQAGNDLEFRIRNQIIKGHGTLLDQQGINGTGASGQLQGILGTPNVGAVVGGTNGANFSRAFITQFENVAGVAGAVLERMKYLTTFALNSFGKRTEISAGSGRFLIENASSWLPGGVISPTGQGNRSLIDNYPAFLSSNVPSNLVKGSSGAVCSAVIFMDPNDAKFMQFAGLQIIVDPYSQGGSALTNYYAHQYVEFRVLRPGSFVVSVDMLTP